MVSFWPGIENNIFDDIFGRIINGNSRDTDNIGYTRHRTKTSKINTTQKTKKMSNTYPTNTSDLNPDG
jgi:hypothetical protein